MLQTEPNRTCQRIQINHYSPKQEEDPLQNP